MYATRPTLYGTRHAVSAGHYLAAAAGFAVLEAGGNAIDAGCAAGIALGVVLPDLVNVAGVAPIIIRKADGTVETIAGLGTWPKSIPADLFMREHGGKIPNGVLRTVVPAAPDAWITALERHGTMGFGDVAQYALRHARDGYAVYPLLAQNIRDHAAEYARWPGNAAIFLPGGRQPQVGEKFVQSDLARTLQYMVDEERKAAGKGRLAGLAAAHAAFYRGDIAREIAGFMAREGGYLTMEDLAGYRSKLEPAVRREWRGHEVITCGPWCQGPALLEALLLMERGGISGMAHNSADYIHLFTESMKAAMADREYHFGDPAFIDVPLDRLLAEGHLAARLAEIDPARALPGMPGPILGSNLPPGATRPEPAARSAPMVEADTSYCCVVDRWGNAFSATPSDGSWNSPVVPGLGIIPSNRGSQSRPDPSHPCGVAPGKRPRLTPNPAMIVTRDGGVMPFGTPGGDVQIQAMLQVVLNILQHGMEVQDAIEAPRFASYSFPSSFAPFDYFPGRLAVESRVPEAVRGELAGRGHEVKDWPEKTWLAGTVEVILTDPRTGMLAAGADPRRPAYAIAA
ncbi:gamma-glutamyltranspeptidase [Siccirubricoccus deserti]|uniref:Gamma-glutamyltransferase n=1 Tax=Siccirubricoccus deserti TaxID=2013562 RepID=A0A9X0QZ23_9PROT|nr:gamma-glutamyltransferase [Siccirubricoccus deserti]MBC4015543.1 gamma-glutamyltransferase [Siccirubricoccus deserti]GGC42565.1 gamma-glutamyltranspeptidase [Siccirubricoccus deserti]